MSDAAPPGWYPDGTGGQRYWDGSRWLAAPPPGPPPSGPPPSGPPPSGPPPSGPRSWADATYAPPPGPPPRKSRAVLWAVLGVAGVVLVAALVTTLVLVTGGDDGDRQATDASSRSAPPADEGTDEPDAPETTEPTEEPQGDPAETVQAFIDAARDGDCAAIEELVTDDFLTESGDCSTDDFDDSSLDGVELEVGEVEIDGDTATVGLVSTFQGETAEVGLLLVYEDDVWLIDGTDLPDDAPAPPSASAPTVPAPS